MDRMGPFFLITAQKKKKIISGWVQTTINKRISSCIATVSECYMESTDSWHL